MTGYLLLYASTLFRVPTESLSQWDVTSQDVKIILKVTCVSYYNVFSHVLLLKAQENHAMAFNRFIRHHPQWKKAVSKKIELEKLLVDIEESALIYFMYNLKI